MMSTFEIFVLVVIRLSMLLGSFNYIWNEGTGPVSGLTLRPRYDSWAVPLDPDFLRVR